MTGRSFDEERQRLASWAPPVPAKRSRTKQFLRWVGQLVYNICLCSLLPMGVVFIADGLDPGGTFTERAIGAICLIVYHFLPAELYWGDRP
jgi:hypothetical protein